MRPCHREHSTRNTRDDAARTSCSGIPTGSARPAGPSVPHTVRVVRESRICAVERARTARRSAPPCTSGRLRSVHVAATRRAMRRRPRHLRHPALQLQARGLRGNDAERGHLPMARSMNTIPAAAPAGERHVRTADTRMPGPARPQDAQRTGDVVICRLPAGANRVVEQAEQVPGLGVPPTVNGSNTTGRQFSANSESAALVSL